MSKIPKEIVDKIEQRNALNEEIAKWCRKNLDMSGMDSDYADITDCYIGNEQGKRIVKSGVTRYAGGKIGTREIIIGKPNTRVNIFI